MVNIILSGKSLTRIITNLKLRAGDEYGKQITEFHDYNIIHAKEGLIVKQYFSFRLADGSVLRTSETELITC